jgi:hypothetical protein
MSQSEPPRHWWQSTERPIAAAKPTPPEPPESLDARIMRKFLRGELAKFIPIVIVVIALYMNGLFRVAFLWDWTGALLPIVIVVPWAYALYHQVIKHYRDRYNQYPPLDLTVYDPDDARNDFRDYRAIQSMDIIHWTAAYAKLARQALLALRRKRYLKPPATPPAAAATADPPATPAPLTESALLADLEATLEREFGAGRLQFNLLTFAEVPTDDPYPRLIVITDCDLNKHLGQGRPDEVFIGALGIKKNCPRLSTVKIGKGKDSTVVALPVESRENMNRIVNQEQVLAQVPGMLVEAQRSHDIWLSKALVEINVDLLNSLESKDVVADNLRKIGYPLADQLAKNAATYGRPVKEPITRKTVLRLLKWVVLITLAIVATVVVSVAVVAVVVPALLRFLASTVRVPDSAGALDALPPLDLAHSEEWRVCGRPEPRPEVV